jgi:hypothetical protein
LSVEDAVRVVAPETIALFVGETQDTKGEVVSAPDGLNAAIVATIPISVSDHVGLTGVVLFATRYAIWLSPALPL